MVSVIQLKDENSLNASIRRMKVERMTNGPINHEIQKKASRKSEVDRDKIKYIHRRRYRLKMGNECRDLLNVKA